MASKDACDSANNKNYIALAQVYAIISSEDFFDKCKAISRVLQNEININYQIPDNTFFTHTQPKMIGYTALHMALEKLDLDIFKQLLESNADFTIEDKEGHTVLHKAIERSYRNYRKCWELKGKLEHPFANLVLNAHVEQNNSTNAYNKYGISNFHIACMMNHAEAVEFFIKSKISADIEVNASSLVFPGYTALHFAARYSSLESAEVLINLGADVYQIDAKGYTSLHILIERTLEILDCINVQKQNLCAKFIDELDRNRKMIRMLFERMNVNADYIGLTFLHIACILHDQSMAKEIISLVSVDNFIYKDSPIWAGYTSLHFAAHVSMDMVKLLMKHGANIVAEDVNGVTPFSLCMERFTVEDIHFIILSSSLWNSIKFSDDYTKLSDFILALQDQNMLMALLNTVNISKIVIPLSSPLWPGYSMLHLAVLFCDRVNKMEDIYYSTDYFETNIEECDYLLQLFRNDYQGEKNKLYYRRIEYILYKSRNLVNLKDAYNSTPLHLAFRLQNRSVIKLLLTIHRKIKNITDKDGLSHFYIACAMGHKKLAGKLLKQGADVNRPVTCNFEFLLTNQYRPDPYYGIDPLVFFGTSDWTPLHLAVVTVNSHLAMLLLKNGANINACDTDGLTPVHRVLQLNTYNIAKTLLSVNDLKDWVTPFGLSYLHIACLVGDKDLVKKLLDLGADIEAVYSLPVYPENSSNGNLFAKRLDFFKCFAGYTPLHIATIKGHQEVIHLLIKRGANIFAKNADSSVIIDALIYSGDVDLSDEFVRSLLKDNTNLQKQLKDEIGLTQLHIECFNPGELEVKSILQHGAAANACVHSDSPVWPKKTALHFLAEKVPVPRKEKDDENNETYNYLRKRRVAGGYSDFYNDVCNKLQQSAKWLLQCGADVTLGDINQSTPVHAAARLLFWDGEEDDEWDMNNKSSVVKKYTYKHRFPSYLVAGQKDFSVNPVDIRGMSHFHIACACNEVESVTKFLKHGVDVNGPFAYFCKRYSGFTPLHLAAYHRCRDIVVLLLKHGANVHARDSLGNTPLHVAAAYCRYYNNVGTRLLAEEDVFEMLIRHGAQVDSLNLWGETPLSVLMRSGIMTFRGVQILIRHHHCCVNVFNARNGKGFLAEILTRYASYKTMKNSFFYKAVLEDPLKNYEDRVGRTVIHNIVSIQASNIIYDFYTSTIDDLIKIGFDIDHQDEKGWTALHTAAHFGNYNGIIGLLDNGADINLSDLGNKSAFKIYLERNNINETNQSDVIGIFILQVYRLAAAGLKISRSNRQIIAQLSNHFILHDRDMQTCDMELNLLRKEKIDSTFISWFDLLSHTKASFRVLREHSSAMAEMFEERASSLRERFPAFGGLMIMQYRKAAERIRFMEPAIAFFSIIAKCNFPALCSHYIIEFLSNRDLKNLANVIE